MNAPSEPSVQDLLAALHRSHDRFVAAIPDDVDRPSYHDWTIAQVASHLGSGAQIFELFLDAGLRELPAPGVEQFQPVWEVWNAKSPAEQAGDAVYADAQFLNRLDGLTSDERTQWQLDLFGSRQSLAGMLRMRLAEHAVHTWDIAVALDPGATVDATELFIDNMSALVGRAGKGASEPVTVHVRTNDPDRRYLLELSTDHARLASASDTDAAAASLRLPGEAFVRLVYGRLDPEHTPDAVEVDGVALDTIRRSFPGI